VSDEELTVARGVLRVPGRGARLVLETWTRKCRCWGFVAAKRESGNVCRLAGCSCLNLYARLLKSGIRCERGREKYLTNCMDNVVDNADLVSVWVQRLSRWCIKIGDLPES